MNNRLQEYNFNFNRIQTINNIQTINQMKKST